MSIADTWMNRLIAGLRPYIQREPLAALMLGISSGFPYAMLGATLTTRLAQDGIDKKSVTAFSLAFLVYNLKFLWAPLVGVLNPKADLAYFAMAAVAVGVAGATFDIVIDAYRIELLKPEQLGVGSGMSQYGWRIGSVAAGSLALYVASAGDWGKAYMLCAGFALPAMLTGLFVGEPTRHITIGSKGGISQIGNAIIKPLSEFFMRRGAMLVLLFILLHKIGDTLANLTFRLLLNDLHFTNEEIATYDVGVGFFAYLIGIFIGGFMYASMGMKRSVLVSLILMAVSNLSFAWLAATAIQTNCWHSRSGSRILLVESVVLLSWRICRPFVTYHLPRLSLRC